MDGMNGKNLIILIILLIISSPIAAFKWVMKQLKDFRFKG